VISRSGWARPRSGSWSAVCSTPPEHEGKVGAAA